MKEGRVLEVKEGRMLEGRKGKDMEGRKRKYVDVVGEARILRAVPSPV